MKLYYANSVCSLAVRIIIHELQIICEYEAVDLKSKQTENGFDFLKINPKGSVPALVLSNNEILTENAIILQYLADSYHADTLLPTIGLKRYRVLEWLNFITTDLHRYCAPLFWSKIPEDLKLNLFMPVLNRKLLIIDHHLMQNKFLSGDVFTLPDSYLFVIAVWLTKLKINIDQWPNLARYFVELKQRPSIQQALEEESLLTFM